MTTLTVVTDGPDAVSFADLGWGDWFVDDDPDHPYIKCSDGVQFFDPHTGHVHALDGDHVVTPVASVEVTLSFDPS